MLAMIECCFHDAKRGSGFGKQLLIPCGPIHHIVDAGMDLQVTAGCAIKQDPSFVSKEELSGWYRAEH